MSPGQRIIAMAVIAVLVASGSLRAATYTNTVDPVSIADNGTVVMPVFVPDSFTISDVNVTIMIFHSWDADLDVTLVHPDGTRVLTTARSTACVWDPQGPESRELVRLTGDGRLLYGTWSPDGQSILTCWDDGSVRLFEAIPWNDSDSDDNSIDQRVRQWRNSRFAK